jgi:peptidoglycan/xylan/chitin deacetylase (PgdA/CDA1 family)
MNRLPALALMAHDVDDDQGPRGAAAEAGLSVSLNLLVDTVETLRSRGYRFVKLADFVDERGEGGVALLTFDDGFARLRTRVVPALRSLNVPAVCFVVTETLAESTDFFPQWLFSLRDAFAKAPAEVRRSLDTDPVVSDLLRALREDSLDAVLARPAVELYSTFYPRVSYAALDRLRGAVAELGIVERTTLDRKAILEMKASGVFEFGAHSIAHRNLAQVPASEARRQVVESTRSVASLLGIDPREVPFAYPYGQVSPAARRAVAREGRVGFTVAQRTHLRGDALSLLPRLAVDETVLERAAHPPRYASLIRERFRIRTVPLRERARQVKNQLRGSVAHRARSVD